MLYGVDVHGGYQAGLDFGLLRRQGYTFAAVKASQGTAFVGPQFATWIRAGRAAGLIMGAYHWIVRGDAAAQCDHFLDVLKSVGGPNGLLVQLDCEDTATWADVQAWVKRWNERTDHHPFAIYTGKWWWNAPGRQWNGASLTPYLWDSHYTKADADGVADDPAAVAAQIPAAWWTPQYGGWKSATILQYTSRGDAGGLANNVDLNATHMSREQLLALTRAPEEVPVTGLTQAERDQKLTAIDVRFRPFVSGKTDPYKVSWTDDPDDTESPWAVQVLARLDATLAALTQRLAGDLVDEAAIAATVLAGLTPERIAEAIPAELAQDVVDELVRRLTPTTP